MVLIRIFVLCMFVATALLVGVNEYAKTYQSDSLVLPTACFALGISQVGLLAVWLTFGGRRLSIRLMFAVIVGIHWSWFYARYAGDRFGQWCAIFGLMTSFVVVPLLVARLFKLGIRRSADKSVLCRPAHQFFLPDIFGWILLAAIVAISLRTGIDSWIGSDYDPWVMVGGGIWFAIQFAFPCVTLTLAIFRQRHWLFATLCAMLTSIGGSAALMYWQLSPGEPPYSVWIMGRYVAGIVAIVATSLLLFRRLGYRIIRQTELTQTETC